MLNKKSHQFLGPLLSLILIIGLPVLIVALVASDIFLPEENKAHSQINLVKHLAYFIDDKSLSIDALLEQERASDTASNQWKKTNGNSLQLYFSEHPIWIKIPVTSDWRTNRVLQIGSALLDSVDAYWVNKNIQHIDKQGDHHKTYNNSYLTPVFFLPNNITEGHIYINIQSGSVINIPVTLWSEINFSNNNQNSSIILGGIFGILMVMVLYNIGVWYSVRETSYLLYICYSINVGLYLACLTGFGNHYLWPLVSPEFNDNLYWICALFSFMFGAFFMDNFLGLKQNNPLAHKAIRWMLIVYFFLFIGFCLLPEREVSGLSYLLGCVASLLALFTGIVEWKKGTPGAKFFTIAWVLLLVGTVTYILMVAGWLPNSFITYWMQPLGITAETVLLSFALGERVALLRTNARKATETALSLER